MFLAMTRVLGGSGGACGGELGEGLRRPGQREGFGGGGRGLERSFAKNKSVTARGSLSKVRATVIWHWMNVSNHALAGGYRARHAMSDARSAQSLAYMMIRDRIRSGQLPGGARLVAEELAAELSLSRMPVREAIRQLDSEGLVVIRPNRGATVVALQP